MATLYASVRLDRSYFALATNTYDTVQCGTSGRSEVFTREGSFRNYADGRTRVILGNTVTNTNAIQLRALSQENASKVNGWVGKTVLFRDSYGRRIYGTFLAITRVNIKLTGMTDMTVSLQDVTYDETIS